MKVFEAKLRYRVVRKGKLPVMNRADLIAAYMRRICAKHPMSEGFYVLSLNRRNRLLYHVMISLGSATSCHAHPREVFRAAVVANACGIVVCHNHPSGDPSPSPADLTLTKQLRSAARIMDIELVDHVIVGEVDEDPSGLGFYSFRAADMI